MKKQTLIAALVASVLTLPILVNAASNTSTEIPLSGFPGCSVQPPKDGCDARISCSGVGTIMGNTGIDVQSATEEAVMEAKNELAMFYSNKQKAQKSLSKVREDTMKSTSDGGKAISNSATRLMASVSSSSAESILSGVQILSRTVDAKQQVVTVKVGVSCKSQAAAANSQANSAGSATPGSSNQSSNKAATVKADKPESFKVAPSGVQDSHQEVKNANDF